MAMQERDERIARERREEAAQAAERDAGGRK
jgi:hypothetical protein